MSAKAGDKPLNNWSEFFRIKRSGKTFYVTWKDSETPISPDFRERFLARHWIRARYQDLVFDREFLGV